MIKQKTSKHKNILLLAADLLLLQLIPDYDELICFMLWC